MLDLIGMWIGFSFEFSPKNALALSINYELKRIVKLTIIHDFMD